MFKLLMKITASFLISSMKGEGRGERGEGRREAEGEEEKGEGEKEREVVASNIVDDINVGTISDKFTFFWID